VSSLSADTFGNHNEKIVRFGAAEAEVLKVLAGKDRGARFRSLFGYVGLTKLRQLTGLDPAFSRNGPRARRNERCCGEGS